MAFLEFPSHPGKGSNSNRVREAETSDGRAEQTAKMGHTLQSPLTEGVTSALWVGGLLGMSLSGHRRKSGIVAPNHHWQ